MTGFLIMASIATILVVVYVRESKRLQQGQHGGYDQDAEDAVKWTKDFLATTQAFK